MNEGVIMEWTCARCGKSATAEAWNVLTSAGWTLSVIGDCLCGPCLQPRGPMASQVAVPIVEPPSGHAVEWPIRLRCAGGSSLLAAASCEPKRPPPHLVLVR
jgi:hypothetical protein